jgi:hypothetical protein
MTYTRVAPRSQSISELAAVLAVGLGFISLFGAGRALVELLSILECSGAMGGTRDLA